MVVKKKAKKKPARKKVSRKKPVRRKPVRKVSKKKPVRRKVVRKKPVSSRTKSLASSSKKRERKKENPSVSRKDFETFQFGVQRLKELEKELNSMDTRGFAREEQIIRAKLKNVSEIPNIERQLKTLKAKIHKKYSPKRKRKSPAKEISEDIEDIKGTIKGMGRSRKESLEDIKEEIKKLKKPKSLGPLDSGVGILVDTNFNAFLNQTKRALSNRIKAKEETMDNTLRIDLQKREDNFKRKHADLIAEFNKKKREVEEKFNEMKRKAEEEFNEMKRKAEEELDKKSRKVSEGGKRTEERLSKKFDMKVRTSLQREVSEHFNEKLKQKLNVEKVQLGKVYKAELQQHALTELEKQKQILRDALEKSQEHMHEKLLRDFNKRVHEEITNKEKLLRRSLVNEFELKLQKKIQDHEQQIKQRKLDLELEMQKKIKQVLK